MSAGFKKKSGDNGGRGGSSKLSLDVHVTEASLLEFKQLIRDKLNRIQIVLQNTLSQLNVYRGLNIISGSDVIVCTTTLIECYEKTQVMTNAVVHGECTMEKINEMIDQLQQIIDKLSIIMCGYGTQRLEDIFFISFGADLSPASIEHPVWRGKYDLLLRHLRPIGYKTIHWKQSRFKPRVVSEQGFPLPAVQEGGGGNVTSSSQLSSSSPVCVNKIVEEVLQVELANQYECFDIDFSGKSTFVKIYGLRAVFHNEKTQKTLIVQGIVDNVPLECTTNAYVHWRKREIFANVPNSETFQPDILRNIMDAMTIKDILIYGNDDVYKKHMAIVSEVNYVKFNKLNTTIKKFLDMDVYNQRAMLMNLLTYNREEDIQYITYLLYDLISAKTSGMSTDSTEQQLMYDSFPWRVKLFFKDTMKNTLKFTKDSMNKYDINRVSLEQQVYVMKAPENVREKAMTKLKEVKGKTDDSGTKAKQYLEGLLKIPFGVYREEPVLKKTKTMNALFRGALTSIPSEWTSGSGTSGSGTSALSSFLSPAKKAHYTVAETAYLVRSFFAWVREHVAASVRARLPRASLKQLAAVFALVADNLHIGVKKTTTPKQEKIAFVEEHLGQCGEETVAAAHDLLLASASSVDLVAAGAPLGASTSSAVPPSPSLVRTVHEMRHVEALTREFQPDLQHILEVLDDSIHGHAYAKRQILKIISQWMNGEQTGYCFGFEGSPGVGKTSLAKRGLAKCLKDADGQARPFAFIALGGSSNGSTLEGHSYTYVNSTWGRIVDVLMDSKCLNPIIYIDELDKVSKTEHGKEIIGILMHLIDPTQNTGFQDKYFSGIDVDLSKALFIFSYNDPNQIDTILLDRIHRIRFDNLSIDEKIVIVRSYMLPEITRKMGLEGAVELSDAVIEHIVETYTLESGVRKLKEVMFDLHGEINVELLQCAPDAPPPSLPIRVTVDDLETKYLVKYDKITEKRIHEHREVGVINGLWANALGRGGIIPIQTMYFPSHSFLELKLTGMQGDVMKESMNVAKSLAWSLLSDAERAACLSHFEKTKEQGLHIHCPDGAVSKDGPSAGAAITVAIYSLLSGKPIDPLVAMTGEVNLQGKITEIGGLEHKILGGLRAGVRKFLYPVANQLDLERFLQKAEGKTSLQEVVFVPVAHIRETFAHFLESE